MIRSKTQANRDIAIYTYCPVCGKRQYQTKGEAERVLAQLKRKRKGYGSVYLCNRCGHWHTTSESRERSKGRKQGITTRKIEEEIMRKQGVKPIDPYTLIRIEQAKRELHAIQNNEEHQELRQTAVVVSAMEEAHEKLQQEVAAEAYESLAAALVKQESAPAAVESEQTIEQKPFNKITGMKIFIESEDQQTTLFVGVNTEGEKDLLRLAISTKDEQEVNSTYFGANISYEMVSELIEALNIQKSKMKR